MGWAENRGSGSQGNSGGQAAEEPPGVGPVGGQGSRAPSASHVEPAASHGEPGSRAPTAEPPPKGPDSRP